MSAEQSPNTISVPTQDVVPDGRDDRKRFFDDLAALRMTLLANGYSPIPNRDKATYTKEWPTLVIDAASIDSWSRRKRRDTATGIRVENGLCVVDADVDDAAVMAKFETWLDGFCEKRRIDYPLVRRGKGAKGAFFFRVDETFARITSLGWIRPGTTADDGVHRLEVFGGGSPRQFGSFGPHTLAPAGGTLISYRWEGPSPTDIPLRELPLLTKADVFTMVDEMDRILLDAGWIQFEKSTRGEGSSATEYDLDPAMEFAVLGEGTMSLGALRKMLTDGAEGLRCSASFLEGKSAKNESRCLIHKARSGSVAIWDSASSTTHYERSHAPVDHTADIAKLGAQLKLLEDRRKYRLVKGDSVASATAKLLQTYAFCGSRKDVVIPFLEPSMPSMSLKGFQGTTMPLSRVEQGPKGGEKRINPADLWYVHPERKTVAGVLLRPDMAFPLFDEDGVEYVNTYEPPIHAAAGGDATIGIDFMEQLLPDAAEREWFMRWFAYKFRHPHVPGPAVLMVARDYGTGRGTLMVLMEKVFGGKYVRGIPFATFTGQNSQSQYNEWAADSVLVFVNESSEAGDAKPWQRKSDVYEHLKEIVDPRPQLRLVNRKGEPNYHAILPTSYIIATNNPDALPLPESDRRFAVLSNGVPRDMAYWERLSAWMADHLNIGAFVRELLAVDLEGYSPFDAPPKTTAKSEMADLASSDLDRAFAAAVANLKGEVCCVEQLVELVRQVRDADDLDLPERWEKGVRKMIQRKLRRVGVKDGANWRVRIGEERYAPYATTRAAYWSESDSEQLREEILKTGLLKGAKISTAAFVR